MDRRAIIGGAFLLALLYFGGRITLKAIIRKFEGLRLTPYKDEAGIWSIGYGHKIVPGDPYWPQGAKEQITLDEAEAQLDKDLEPTLTAVRRLVTVPLNQNQLDALTSFVYNVGTGAFGQSTLLRKLNAGDYAGAADEFGRWIHSGGHVSGGLIDRREQEKALFLA